MQLNRQLLNCVSVFNLLAENRSVHFLCSSVHFLCSSSTAEHLFFKSESSSDLNDHRSNTKRAIFSSRRKRSVHFLCSSVHFLCSSSTAEHLFFKSESSSDLNDHRSNTKRAIFSSRRSESSSDLNDRRSSTTRAILAVTIAFHLSQLGATPRRILLFCLGSREMPPTSLYNLHADCLNITLELVDAECYRLAYQFVCHVLQPPCEPPSVSGRPATVVRPCRDFCLDFWSGCGARLPLRFQDALDCSRFLEYSTIGEACIPKPGCKESLKLRDLTSRLCDGVPDCADLSDELTCRYCRPGHILCANSPTCIPAHKRCNGHFDCPDHSDEKACCSNWPCHHKHFSQIWYYLTCWLALFSKPTKYFSIPKLWESEKPPPNDMKNGVRVQTYMLCTVALSPSVAGLPALPSAHPGHTRTSGHVVFNEKGSLGKLCVDNLNTSGVNNSAVLRNVATSLCRTLLFQEQVLKALNNSKLFREMISETCVALEVKLLFLLKILPQWQTLWVGNGSVEEFRVETDKEEDVSNYVQMEDPTADQISFVQVPCPEKSVLHVTCKDAECGIQPARVTSGVEGLAKMAALGDWPWHAALLKDGVHVCDATVVHPQWLLTSASCFQGQQKAEWVARLGSVRLTSTTPWQQERHVVGMTKSPVEGSTVVLVKLDSPLLVSDFVRPICLPHHSTQPVYTNCHTLGWTRNREVLQRVELLESRMDQCANVSIMSVNSLCADSVYSMEDCSKGLLISIESLRGLYKDLKAEGYSYVMSSRCNQDILESYFSKIRGLGRFYDYPLPTTVTQRIKTLILSRNASELITSGNCIQEKGVETLCASILSVSSQEDGQPQTTSQEDGQPQTTSQEDGQPQTTSQEDGQPQTTSQEDGQPQTTLQEEAETANDISDDQEFTAAVNGLVKHFEVIKGERNLELYSENRELLERLPVIWHID
ncbi:hypothetical protein J6590_054369 [Homalodisca vitripennis]|nr:hypothetical protein J6590_054369 [Homalodisca vitripennis]